MILKYLNDGDPWVLGEEIPDCDLFFSQIWLRCFVNDFAKHTGLAYSKILCKYNGYYLWFYFGEKNSNAVGENIVKRIVREPGFAHRINLNIVKEADKLRKFSTTIPQNNLNTLSNKKLWQIFQRHDKLHSDYYTWCWIPVAADMFHNNLTERLKKYLLDKGVGHERLNEYFVVLTQPIHKSLIIKEQEDLLKIATRIKPDEVFSTFVLEKLKKLWKKYYYTKHIWITGEYTFDDYVDKLREVTLDGISAIIHLKKINDNFNHARMRKRVLIKRLKIEQKWQKVFAEFSDFMVTKIYRRYAQIFAIHHMAPVLREIACRHGLAEKMVRFMLPTEVHDLLINGKKPNDLLKRTKSCVYYAEKNCDRIYTGGKAKKLGNVVVFKQINKVDEFRGEIGCQGRAVGQVKIVVRAADMVKMNRGDILVSIATDPVIVPAMKKAAAIVTEQGGVTSHAAIVSRELNIPCVIGTKIATKVLKDGDIVEVDASRGIVQIIKRYA